MKKSVLAALLTLTAAVSGANSASLPARLTTYGFDKNLTLQSVSSSPAVYYSPHVGVFHVAGTADIAPSAGVAGNSKSHNFSLATNLVVTGIIPISPALSLSSAASQVSGSGPVSFDFVWSGLVGEARLPDGYYRYDVEATLLRVGPGADTKILDQDSAAGNEFIYDATPPSLSLHPGDGAFLNALQPTLSAAYVDALAGVEPSTVSLVLDGEDVTEQFTVTASGATWSPALTEGAHNFTATVVDRAGNVTTKSVSFVIDVTPPSLSLTPQSGAQVLVQTPDLVGTYEDARSGINTASVSAAIDGNNATSRFSISSSQAAWSKDDALEFGDHTFTVSVADNAGNVSTATVSFSIVAPYRYFTLEGDEIRFSVVNAYFLVKLADGVTPAEVLGNLVVAGAAGIATAADPFGFYEVSVAAGGSVSSVQAAAKQIPGVERVYPVVAWPDGRATGTAEGVYVRFSGGTSDTYARAILEQAGAVAIDADCCEAYAYAVRGSLNDASDDFVLADKLRGMAGVEYAAPSLVIRYAESIGGTLPDGTTTAQGYLAQIGVPDAWPTVYGGDNYFVTWTATPIGVLSTGVQSTHPGLAGRVLPGYSAFGGTAEPEVSSHHENGLGTAMAGILATNWGSYGLKGIMKDSPILPAKVREYSCGQISGTCFWTTSDAAIKAGAKSVLDSGARVLVFDSRYAEYLPQSIAFLNDALPAGADGRGAVAVFPMGDEKHEIYTYRASTPLNITNTAFVTAIDQNGRILERANVHATDSTRVNFAAPGSPILTLDVTGANGAGFGDTAVWQGTPMAAAIFAGSAALSYLIDSSLTADEVLALAKDTGTLSLEEIERSPLFTFFLWKLSILHMQKKVELDLCESSYGQADLGVIHQASLPGLLGTLPLPGSVQLFQNKQPHLTTAAVGFSVYKYTGNPGNPIVESPCVKFDWTGNKNLGLLVVDKRVIRFSNTTADEIKLRVDASGGGSALTPDDATALGLSTGDAANYRVLRRSDPQGLTAWYEAKAYSVLGVLQAYSRTATLHMWQWTGGYLTGANTQIRACVWRCIFIFCSATCSPARSLLDVDDDALTESQRQLKAAILANESLSYEYRQLEAEFDLNSEDIEDRILTLETAAKLEAFRQELSTAVGAELVLSAVGLFDNPMEQVGIRYGELIR